MRFSLVLLTVSLLSTSLFAQVTVRDKLVALPPVSICQDGATHKTIVTNHRLRPGAFNLGNFFGMPIEVTGTPGSVTCKFLNVTAIRAITVDQRSVASKTATTAKVEFYGTDKNVYFLYAGALSPNSLVLPGIDGPIHLNPNAVVFLGTFTPISTSVPYATFFAPLTSVTLGVNIFDQAVAAQTGTAQMTNVDVFKF